jgi:hypothetical protein
LLSAEAGLRAREIANLTWGIVLDPTGAIGHVIELHDQAANSEIPALLTTISRRPKVSIAAPTMTAPAPSGRCCARVREFFERCKSIPPTSGVERQSLENRPIRRELLVGTGGYQGARTLVG